MTTINGDTPIVYSSDNKLWLDMSRKDAYAKGDAVLKLFNYADKDNDQNLSQDELNRYNGPVIIENYEEISKSRIVTKGEVCTSEYGALISTNGIGIVASTGTSDVSLTSHIVTNKEEEFYPGLEISKVSKKGSEIFTVLDTNRDNKLSKTEIETAVKIKEKMYKTFEKLANEIKQKTEKPCILGMEIGTGTGVVGGAIAGGMSFGAEGFVEGCIGGCYGALAGAGVGFLVGAGIGAYISYKNKAKFSPETMKKTLEESLGNLKNHPYAKYLEKVIIKQLQDI